jgi:hypothetical protein
VYLLTEHHALSGFERGGRFDLPRLGVERTEPFSAEEGNHDVRRLRRRCRTLWP